MLGVTLARLEAACLAVETGLGSDRKLYGYLGITARASACPNICSRQKSHHRALSGRRLRTRPPGGVLLRLALGGEGFLGRGGGRGGRLCAPSPERFFHTGESNPETPVGAGLPEGLTMCHSVPRWLPWFGGYCDIPYPTEIPEPSGMPTMPLGRMASDLSAVSSSACQLTYLVSLRGMAS